MHQLEELTNTGTVLDCHLKTEIDEYLSSCKKLYSTRSCELAQNYLASMLIYFEDYGKTSVREIIYELSVDRSA
jgi:hypothetical protein